MFGVAVEHFLRALFTKTDDIQEVVAAFNDVLSEEDRLSIVEMLVSMHELSGTGEQRPPGILLMS